MISTQALVEGLRQKGARLFAGVPDSLLQSLSSYLLRELGPAEHMITANEGNAVALAMGHYMATGNPGVVYLQNSGLGNCINPLTSLADREVYAIPMVLIVGWRGEPGKKDEPQHVKQGRITAGQLDLLGIPYWVVDSTADIDKVLEESWQTMQQNSGPVALLVKANSLDAVSAPELVTDASLKREDAIGCVLECTSPEDIVIATTGKAGRELFELRERRGEAQRDFLTVGGMGHTSSIALGVALARPERRVVCLDGDGSLLMHLGAAAIVGDARPRNLIHVLLNNGAHESVGGQPTVARTVDFASIVRACGYASYHRVDDLVSLRQTFGELDQQGPHFVEVLLAAGSRSDLGRPTLTPAQNKQQFMAHIGVN